MAYIPGLDAKDNFQEGYIKRGGPTNRIRNTPAWMRNEKTIRIVLLRSFPNLKTNEGQNKSAARWLEIIRLYYQSGWHALDVAEELHISEKVVYDTAQRLMRAGVGLRTTGKPRTGKRGRPKSIRF